MTDTLKSVVEEELQKAYELGVQEGMKREHAMWVLAKVGQEIELGITYEEANPPEPYCKRCGKKLGTEAHDVHTCTPKEIQPVAWVDSLSGARPDCVTDFKYLSVAQIERKEHLQYIALYTAPPKKEWVGLTDEDKKAIYEQADTENWHDQPLLEAVEAKLKEKNT